MTAAELVSGRANALLPMMGMTVIKGNRPTLAERKAKGEHQKCKQLHSGELSRVEQAFLESVEATVKRLEGK